MRLKKKKSVSELDDTDMELIGLFDQESLIKKKKKKTDEEEDEDDVNEEDGDEEE